MAVLHKRLSNRNGILVSHTGRIRPFFASLAGRFKAESARTALKPVANTSSSLMRIELNKMLKVHVGCGPHNIMDGWINVDIRPFKGIDRVVDVTKEWCWTDVDYIYGEHFIEHIHIEGILTFLVNAGNSLKPNGVLRLSTPNLTWVMKTHYRKASEANLENIYSVLRTNRAFHGWGHCFLYDKDMLEFLMTELNFAELKFYSYGESDDPVLKDIEKHGGFNFGSDLPNTLIFEAKRGENDIAASDKLMNILDKEFIRYVRAGH